MNPRSAALLLILIAAQVGCAGTGTHQPGTTAPADTVMDFDDDLVRDTIVLDDPPMTDTVIVFDETDLWNDEEPTGDQALLIRANELRREGEARHDDRDYRGAAQAHSESLDILQGVLGEAHVEVAISLFTLAHVLEHLEEFADMLHLLERGLAIVEGEYGSDHVITAAALTRVAHAHLAMQDPRAARPYLARAVEIYEREDAHAELAVALTLSAAMHDMEGDHARANRLRERAEALRSGGGK